MNPIFSAALQIQVICQERNWSFCFIGGLAVQRWGEPRLTVDVDLALLTETGEEENFVDSLLQRLRSRLEGAKEFALRNRVLLLQSDVGVPVDVSLASIPFERRMIERASSYRFEEQAEIVTCSAEDLVVLKAFAGREKDWLDIEGIIARQGERLDTSLVWRELEPLLELKEGSKAKERLTELLDHL